MRVGMNIDAPLKSIYQTDFRYSDLHLSADDWTLPDKSIVPADVATLPGPGAHQYQGPAYIRPGTYTIACEGTGVLRVLNPDLTAADGTAGYFDANFPVAPAPPQTADAAMVGGYPIVIKTAQHRGIGVTVMATSTGDPLRNLRVLAPGAAAHPGRLWTDGYLASLRPFPVLRGLDWLGTNSSKVANWADRPVGPGRELEGFLDLCASVGADPWINLPHLCASAAGITDYPAELGKLIRSMVNPQKTVYLEYSNECWNYGAGFAQSLYCMHQGAMIVNPATGQPYGAMNGLLSGAAGYGHMANAAFDAAEQAIGDGGPRIVRVFAGQAASVGATGPQNLFGYFLSKVLPAWKWRVGAIACAPYADWRDGSAPYTKAALVELTKAGDTDSALGLLYEGMRGQVAKSAGWCAGWRAGADALGVPLLYYECSPVPTLLWNNPDLAPLATAFLADPRTADYYRAYFESIGPYAALGNAYSHCRPGPWGFLQYLDDTSQTDAGARAYAARWDA